MSFLGTASALSKNGYQSVGGAPWNLKQTITFASGVSGAPSQPTFSADGNYFAICTNYDTVSTGAVYIYYNGGSGTTWTLQQTILGTISNQGFGSTLNFSDDGSYLAIGAPGETGGGATYIYYNGGSGTTWTLQQRLEASARAAGDFFGGQVSLSGTADYLVVGAQQGDTSPYTNNGAAYVFIRSGTSWTQQQKLLAPIGTRESSASFGSALQISQNGSYTIIGASLYNGGTTTDIGIAYIFIRSGSTWSVQASLYGTGISSSQFGRTVNIDNNGSLVCIREPGGAILLQPYLYFYSRSGTSWSQTQVIDYKAYTPIIINNSTTTGTAMQGNGQNLILGLYVNDRAIAISDTTSGYQIEQELFTGITPPPNDFGGSVGIARTANVCAITTTTSAGSQNSVFIFTKD